MDATRFPHTFETAAALAGPAAASLFLVALLCAARHDLRSRSVPNELIAGLLLLWLVAAPLAGLGLRDMATGAAAAAMVFFGTVALFTMGWMGGGDSKLLTVSALWLGADHVVPFLMATMLAGGALAIVAAVLRLLPSPTAPVARIRALALTELPYALAIGLGALAVLPRTFWMGSL